MTTSPNTKTIVSSTHPKKNNRTVPKLVSIALMIMVIACTAYALLTIRDLRTQLQTISADDFKFKKQQTDTTNRMDLNFKKLDSLQEQFSQQLNGVSTNLSQALQERWYQNNDWILLKARYYMELAEINSTWNNNTASTIAILQLADGLLASLHDPELSTVRQALIKEMTQLQAESGMDQLSVLAQLDGIKLRISQLSIKNPFTLKADNTPEANHTETSSWPGQLDNSLRFLEKLVVIRHHDEAIEPLLSPEYESILRESCFLNLQKAQWAVTQRNDEMYQLSLTQAINTVTRAFDIKNSNTQALLKMMQTLQQIHWDAPKPISKEPMLLLNKLIQSNKSSMPNAEHTELPESSKTILDSGEKQ